MIVYTKRVYDDKTIESNMKIVRDAVKFSDQPLRLPKNSSYKSLELRDRVSLERRRQLMNFVDSVIDEFDRN